jgi:hypothetical protein
VNQREADASMRKWIKYNRNGYNKKVVCAFFKEYGVPEPEFEYQFEPTRRWRSDIAWHDQKLLCEVQGGIFTGGAHVRGPAMLREFEKLNRAARLGYRVIFVIPQQLLTKQTVEMVRECLGLCPVPGKHIGQASSL